MKEKFNYWIIPITFFIIGFFCQFWILSLANASFEFKIDDDTREAINTLSEYNNTFVVINQYQGDDCVRGCKIMHYELVGKTGAVAQNDIWAKDCESLCK